MPTDNVDTAVEMTDLRYSWPGSEPLFTGGSFVIKTGERVLIRGKSGSGKSTLLSLLAGIISADAGVLTVLGTELRSLRPSERDRFRADHVGYIFQEHNLLPYLSIADNIKSAFFFSSNRSGKKAGRIAEVAEKLLDELSLDVDPNAFPRHLSVGQRQRVAIARALAGDPELILADEPSSALDDATARDFTDLLFRECDRHNSTLIVVSHDKSLAGLFPRVVEMENLLGGRRV